MKKQFEERNLTMMMDLYELTMANGYFLMGNKDEEVAFDVFYRKNPDNAGFSIFAGLEQIVDYIMNMHFAKEDIEYLRSLHIYDESFLEYLSNFKFKGTLISVKEGTIIYPYTPVMTIKAPLIDAQLVETAILAIFNHECLIATKANRIVKAAEGRSVSDFGARRAHNMDAAVYGARAAYIGGVNSTATILAGQMFDIPVSGTVAHSWIMKQEDEFTAFKKFAEIYPDSCSLLIDTFNVLESGVPNAIRTAHEVLEPMGKRLKSVRLDSGDLAYLSKAVRKMLDKAGLEDCKIVVSNSLDEYLIHSLITQGAKIDMFGVGERLITSKSEPVFGGVYKICEADGVAKIKISENPEKITNPGLKKLYRLYNEEGYAIADLLTLYDEDINEVMKEAIVDSKRPWKAIDLSKCSVKCIQEEVIKDGELVVDLPSVKEIRDFVRQQLDHEIWEEEQRFEMPHIHYLDMSMKLYTLKTSLLASSGVELEYERK